MKKRYWIAGALVGLALLGAAAGDNEVKAEKAEQEEFKATWIALGPKTPTQCIEFYGNEGGRFYSRERGEYGMLQERGLARSYLKPRLKNPDSFEIAEAFYVGQEFYVTYRATNSFNATVLEQAKFRWVSHNNDCAAQYVEQVD